MANIVLKIGKGVEVAAGDVVKWVANDKKEQLTVTLPSPSALGALAVLLEGVAKAVVDVDDDVNNPVNLLLHGSVQIQDFIAVWPELKAFAADIGITKL